MTPPPPFAPDPDADVPPLSPQDQRRRERLRAVFLAHYAELSSFACTHGTREPADAQDAIQTTFQTLLRLRGELLDDTPDPPTQAAQDQVLLHYLYSSVRGRMRNLVDQATTRERLIAPLAPLAPTLHPTRLARPDEALEGQELARDIKAALKLLSRQERRVIRCIRFLGMTTAETAAALHISPGTVGVYLGRATQKLERALRDWLPPAPEPVTPVKAPRLARPRRPRPAPPADPNSPSDSGATP